MNTSSDEQHEEIIKPNELKHFDLYPHLKHNLLHSDMNCNDCITQQSYYCLNCMISTCSLCDNGNNVINNHKDHLLIQRNSCLHYDNSFFKEIEDDILESFSIKDLHHDFFTIIETTFDSLHFHLDQIKEEKIKEMNKLFYSTNRNLKELLINFLKMKEKISKYYEKNEKFFGFDCKKNKDEENTIFLMNFELMNLCDNKNIEVIQALNKLKQNFIDYKETIIRQEQKILDIMNDCLKDKVKDEKFDDFYWDIGQKINSYNEHITQMKTSIYDNIKTYGNCSYINDLVNIFDEKNQQGIQFIFNSKLLLSASQEDFRKSKEQRNGISSNGIDAMTSRGTRFKKNTKVKPKLLSPNNATSRMSKSKSYNHIQKRNNSNHITAQSNHINSTTNIFITIANNPSDITLDDRVKQRYFAYSFIDLYNKRYTIPSSDKRQSTANDKLIVKFEERHIKLKEIAKPIPSTTEIFLYDPSTNNLTRIKVTLERDIHGYIIFPDGLRHILIEDHLYITGGSDCYGNPLKIALCFHIKTYTIKRLDNMLNSHSFHSIEYLESYNSLIVIGGEKTRSCEMFDLFTWKWTRLPELNIARANVNLYYDAITSDIYSLFGLSGALKENNNYSDVIEVLELNDFTAGWLKVDYYKGATLNLRNYIKVVPFTMDTLLICGGKNTRENNLTYALYHLNRNELLKVDEKTLEAYKLEQSKLRFFNGNYNSYICKSGR